ncbi:MAG: phosphotransferase family protein [Gammaproteobacteria bacterium]|nr:phosphotransferase family protein [Gammaproteobacteria bacterium]MBT3870718.1 phosphotransferase family protein [Gammaproteobacteria bacterium]MBT4378235.1 phosphotransferase family protein [Gammaproteobacteria bacterium]MBT4619067.1 phosphotransferase family protein [Gammaproteobacteria bacterium]MBT5197438.1 phosphotransferase family protein [Gammaproteobacteria bacterium]
MLAHITDCKGLVSVDRLSGGASQETYRLVVETSVGEKRLALRRTPGGEYAEITPQHPGLDVEALLMQSALAVGVPEPEVYYVLQREDELGDGFLMEWLDGEALGARIVRSPEFEAIRPKLAYECGKVLAKIHSIDLDATGLRARLWEIPPAEFVEQTWERYRLLDTPQPMIDYVARWLMENLPEQHETALVHNDFRNGNFMLSPDGIVAVLDWEVAHVGDPMRDLGWMCTNSWRFGASDPVGGFGQYEDMFKGYEDESGKTVDPEHVKFWEVFGSFWWSVGCLGMAEHYRSGPDRTVERPAIGRRTSECQVDCVNLLIPGPVEIVKESSGFSSVDIPRTDELLVSVRDFLRNDVMDETTGRANFLSRVAANSLDIVLRELTLGPIHQALELGRLQALFQSDEGLDVLKRRLVTELRDKQISLDNEVLQNHLRQTVVNQVAIDQPKYSGFKNALDNA